MAVGANFAKDTDVVNGREESMLLTESSYCRLESFNRCAVD